MKHKIARKVLEKKILKELHNLSLKLGIKISYKHIPHRIWGRQVGGYYTHNNYKPYLRREVTIHTGLFISKRIAVLAHEIGHAVLGHGNSYCYGNTPLEGIIIMQEEEAWKYAEDLLNKKGYIPPIFYRYRDRHLKDVRNNPQEVM